MQDFEAYAIKYTIIPNWISLCRARAPLYNRGWVFQESFLSRRMMHFSTYPFFECSKSPVRSEGYVSDIVSRGFTADMHLWGDFLSHKQITSSGGEPIWRWWQAIGKYSETKLTRGSDKLVALSGVAKAFSKLLNVPYYAGIWGGSYILECLLWSVYRHIEGGGRDPPTRAINYRGKLSLLIPDYSWFS